MKRLLFISFIVMAVLSFSDAAYSKTYKIATVPWIGWAPLNAAESKGFWKEQGIDVQVIVVPELVASQKLFKNKLVDIHFNMLGSAVSMYMEGLPVTVIAETGWSHGGDQIIIKKDTDIRTLKGGAIGVYVNQVPLTYFMNQYFSKVSLKLSDFQVFEMEEKAMTDKFISGILKGIVSYGADASRAIRDGNGKAVASSADFNGCIPEGMLMMKDTLNAIPKDDLIKIFKGWMKAVKWSNDEKNFKEYIGILNKTMFKDEGSYSEDEYKNMLGTVRIHDPKAMSERNKDGGGLQTYFKDVNAFLKANNMLKKDFKPEDLFDNKVILETLKASE